MRICLLLSLLCSLLGAPQRLFTDAAPQITSHSMTLQNHPLPYQAEVGSLPAKNKKEETKGEIHYIAYFQEGKGRPITFVFNGGPGSSSIWLHMGAFGPKRIASAEEGQLPIPPYQLIENQETLLDLTDLVFVDPIGSGLSSASSDEEALGFYSSFGDVEALSLFIRDFLTTHSRWNSPLYLAGESYGTLRCCGLADYLQSEQGIYLNGLILISSAIDYQGLVFDTDNLLPYPLALPTYAATAWYHGRYRPEALLEEVVAEAREFSYGIYAPFLFRPHLFSRSEKESLYEQLSTLTGLPLPSIKRELGRIDDETFFLNFFPEEKKVLGRYDTRFTGFYTSSTLTSFSQDPSVANAHSIFAGTFHHYLSEELHFPALNYKLFSFEAHHKWEYGSYSFFGYPNFMEGLRRALITNPSLKVFVGMGYFDAVTPFGAAEYCLEHLNLPDAYTPSIQKGYYEGGHMYYLNPSAREKFKQDLVEFYQKEPSPCAGS